MSEKMAMLIAAARKFLVEQGGLLGFGLEIDDYVRRGDHHYVTFQYTSLVSGSSKFTVELDDNGQVISFKRQRKLE